MTRTLTAKKYVAPARYVLPGCTPQALKRILDATAGLWRGRKLDPLLYQRAMRKQYATIR